MGESKKRTTYGRQICVIRKDPKYPNYITGAVYDCICIRWKNLKKY